MGLYPGSARSDGKVVLCNAPLYHGGPLAICGVPVHPRRNA